MKKDENKEISDDRFSIGKFKVSKLNLDTAVERINEAVRLGNTGYICVSNARSAYQSNNEQDYCDIQNNSLLTVADGRPLVWIAHNKGCHEIGQVAGNDLFHSLLSESEKKNYTHYFYGSTPLTIEKMVERATYQYPKAKILAAVSPPFQPLENYDIQSLAEEINKLEPTFFWVGLGAPKQERLMALLQPHLKKTICLGIGLVFEYYAGTVKRAPAWIRNLGLEWLFRSIQQPVQSWKRNFSVVFFWTIRQIVKSKFHYA